MNKRQLRLPQECVERDYTITYYAFKVGESTVYESETEYHPKQEEEEEDGTA